MFRMSSGRSKSSSNRDLGSYRAYSDAESYPEEDIYDVNHKDFQHEDFVATVNSTRVSNRWANRRRSLVKRGHKSAQSHNEENIDYDTRMRQAEAQERRYIEKRKHKRDLRSRTAEREHYRSRTAERDRKQKSQEREREPDPMRKENGRDYKNMYKNKTPIARERPIEANYKISQRNHTHSPQHNAGCTTSTSGHTHGSTPTGITSRNPDDPSSTFSSNRSRGNNYLVLTPEEAKLINSKHKKKLEMEYIHQRQPSNNSPPHHRHHHHPVYDFAEAEMKVADYQSDAETITRQESDGFYRDLQLAKRSRNYSDPDGGYYSGYEKFVGQRPPPEEQKQVCKCVVM